MKLLLGALLFIFYTAGEIYPQTLFSFSAESGYYNSHGRFLTGEGSSIIRLDAKISSMFENENITARGEIKFRPEYWGATGKVSSLRFAASGDLTMYEDNFDWTIALNRQMNSISNNIITIKYDIFSLVCRFNYPLSESVSLIHSLGFGNQAINSSGSLDQNLLFADVKLLMNLTQTSKLSSGVYTEFINSIRKISLMPDESAQAFKWGPVLEFNYLDEFAFNASYRVLFYSSKNILGGSVEHKIGLSAGKVLFDDFSLFLLGDYYIRDIRLGAGSTTLSSLYSSFSRESYLYLKAAYDLTDFSELFIKGGYFSNDLVFDDYKFEGVNLLMGINIKF